jgi:hypothetical protein
MTAAEKLEQSVTRRPDSYVPGRTLVTLLGRHPGDGDRPLVLDHAMHWGTGAVLGALRGCGPPSGCRAEGAPGAHGGAAVVRPDPGEQLGLRRSAADMAAP